MTLGDGAHAADAPERVAGCAAAAIVDSMLPRYDRHAVDVVSDARYLAPDGTVTVVGYNDMSEMLDALTSAFSAVHPNVRFRLDLPGTRFAPSALARGVSAFAPMGALFTPPQLGEYRSITGSDPIAIRIAHASLDPRALTGPLAIFVHRDNPISSLTLGQAARVFAGDVKRWGDLGVEGAWADRSMHRYGLKAGTALAFEFQQRVMNGARFDDSLVGMPQSAEVVDKVAADPSAIGFAAAMRVTPGARIVAIASTEHDKPVAPTCDSIVAGRYALDRYLLIYVRKPVTSLAREFVRFVLSREGQEVIAASPKGYLPLSASDAAAERAKIE